MGTTVPRIYHLLSTPERIQFYLLDRDAQVIDIREQFPILSLADTLQICGDLNVKHTRDGFYPEPFTLDFFITRQTFSGIVHEARSIKTPQDAVLHRVRKRLAVEQRWCERNGIDWALVDTSGFSATLLSTLIFMRGWFLHRYIPDQRQENEFLKAFLIDYSRNRPLKEIIEGCAKYLKRGYTQCLNEFRYCAWTDRIPVDLPSRLSLHLPVVLRDAQTN